MQKPILIIFLSFWLSIAFTQSIPQLIQDAKTELADRNYKRSAELYEDIIVQLEEKNELDSTYLNVLIAYNKSLSHSGQFNKTIPVYHKIIEFTQLHDLKNQNIDARASMVGLYMIKNQLAEADVSIHDILAEDSIGYSIESDCYNYLGQIYARKEKSQQAITYYKKAIEIDRTHQDSSSMPFSCLDLATLYGSIDSQSIALNYLIEGEQYLRPSRDDYKKVTFLDRFGQVYFNIGNYIKAEQYALEQLKLAQELKLKKGQMTSFIFLGDITRQRNKLDEAVAYYEKADSMNQILNRKYYEGLIVIGKLNNKLSSDQPISTEEYNQLKGLQQEFQEGSINWVSMALLDLRIKANDYSKSTFDKNYEQIQEILSKRNKPSLKRSLLDIKYRYYKNKGLYKEANTTLELLQENQKKNRDKNHAFSLEELETKYQVEKKSLQIDMLHEQDKTKNAEINTMKTRMIGGGIALVLLSILAFFLLKLYNKVKSQKEVISKALSQKDLLLREIHHRVKNNLQLISSLLTLQGRSIDDKKALEAINEGKSRVRSMALIHQDLYNKENLTEISVKEYLEKLSKELFGAYRIDTDRIKLTLAIDDIDIDVDTLVPLGLIINELITNCLKYAFPAQNEGEIVISLHESNNNLEFQINDNGIGFDAAEIKANSFGSTLVSALLEQLDGTIDIQSKEGTQIKILFINYK